MSVSKGTARLYPHPFCRDYWHDAAREFRNTRMLIFAALMIALRVALKPFSITISFQLTIQIAFLANAIGAMTYGPVVAVAAAAVSDTLGYLVFPNGPYYFPFILTEIASSVIFALFFYRTRITAWRVLLARFTVVLLVNLVLQTPIMLHYNSLFYPGREYIVDGPRIIKNLALFPLESLVLVYFLAAAMPPLERFGVIKSKSERLSFTWKEAVGLVLLSAVLFGGGSYYLHKYVSQSASYSTEERIAANQASLERIRSQEADLPENQEIVAIVESAYTPFLRSETTWNVAVYEVIPEELAAKPEDFTGFASYSKSKAAKDPALRRLFTAELVTDGSGNVLSYKKTETASTVVPAQNP